MKFILVLTFCNPLLAAAPESNFKKSVEIFLSQSSSVLSQKAMVEAAEKNKLSKLLYWTPSARFNIYKAVPGAETGASEGMAAEVSLNLWKFGGDHKGYQAAKAKLKAENARYSLAKQNFEQTITQILFQVIRQNKIIEIQKKHFGLREESFAVAKARYSQGQLASQELEKVKIELETSKISLSEAELQKIELNNALKALVDADINLSEWPFISELSQQKKLKYRDIRDFFKVRSNLADSEYYNFSSSEIWRESYLPTLDFYARWSQPETSRIKQGEWTAYLGVTIPLWDRLEGSALAAQQAAYARGSELSYQNSVRETRAQLSTLDKRLELTKANVQSALRAAEKLQMLRNDSLRRFRLGRSSVNDLLIDENRFLDAESALLNSMLSYHELLVENCHAAEESIVNCY